MVVFTCNNCGDSVKKPKVEKHVTVECKRRYSAVSLCCVDCLSDFSADTFAEHTKCVTELERYSAKGFVPKPSSNKGERKQNSWIDVVRSVINLPTLTRQQKELLLAISHLDNVPRKKIKFQNFVRSSIRHVRVDPDVTHSVFDLLEAQFKTSTTNVPDADASKGDSTASKDSQDAKEITIDTPQAVSEDHDLLNDSEPKKKKKKLKSDVGTWVDGAPPVDTCVTQEDTENGFETIERQNKKRKKKARKEYNVTAAETAVVVNDCSLLANVKEDDRSENLTNGDPFTDDYHHVKCVSKKKQKKLKLPPTTNATLDIEETENVPHETAEQCNLELVVAQNGARKDDDRIVHEEGIEPLKKKVKLKKDHDETRLHSAISNTELKESSSDSHQCEYVDQVIQKTKSKKRKFAPNDEDSVCGSKKIKQITESSNRSSTDENDFNGCNTFVWEEVIKSLLQAANDNELSLKKMTKKIVNEYRRSFSDNKSYDEIAKKLNKKIRKLPFVTVHKERVKLCASY